MASGEEMLDAGRRAGGVFEPRGIVVVDADPDTRGDHRGGYCRHRCSAAPQSHRRRFCQSGGHGASRLRRRARDLALSARVKCAPMNADRLTRLCTIVCIAGALVLLVEVDAMS